MMVRSDVLAGVHGQHRECLADLGVRSPDAGDAEPAMTFHREQPFVLPLLPRILGLGEFVKSVGEDQAALRRERALLGAEIVDGLAGRSRPAPASGDQFTDRTAGPRLPLHAAHDRRHVGHLDVLARLHVRRSFGRLDVDFEVIEILHDRGDIDLETVVIAHLRAPLSPTCDSSSFPLCSRP